MRVLAEWLDSSKTQKALWLFSYHFKIYLNQLFRLFSWRKCSGLGGLGATTGSQAHHKIKSQAREWRCLCILRCPGALSLFRDQGCSHCCMWESPRLLNRPRASGHWQLVSFEDPLQGQGWLIFITSFMYRVAQSKRFLFVFYELLSFLDPILKCYIFPI